jgi:metal-responsive CopG/Arc/MetJ family transcriptional regulator
MERLDIELDDRVLNGIDERIRETEFDSREAYISFVLEAVVSADDDDDELVDTDADMEDQLRALGYVE